MLKKSIIFVFALFLLTSVVGFANAQQQSTDASQQNIVLKASAGEDKNIVSGRPVLFSGLNSVNPTDKPLNYFWDFGDGSKGQGEETTHTYKQPGVYRVILTVEDFQKNISTDEIIVSVDKDLIILVTDKSVAEQDINILHRFASTQEILLVTIKNDKDEPDYVVSKELSKQLLEAKEDIKQAGSIVLYTSGNVGISAMLELAQSMATGLEKSDLSFSNKTIISITDKSFSATAKISQNVFNLLSPKSIIICNKDALQTVVSSVNYTELIENLKNNEKKYQIVGVHTQRDLGNIGFFNFMSVAVNYMVNKGVSLNTIYLILMLPLIATIMAFARQVIGIKAFGIYMPSIIALSFLSIGIKYGIVIFTVIILSGTIARFLARKIKILYLPRMAIVLTIVSLIIFLLFFVGTYFEQQGIIVVSIFPILIMTFMTEKFIAIQIEQGTKTAVILSIETLVLSIICYFVANWKELEVLILGYPELILITILINILIGRWTGLRLIEYIRFKKLIKND